MRLAIQKTCWVHKAISIKQCVCLGKAKEHADVNHSESNFQERIYLDTPLYLQRLLYFCFPSLCFFSKNPKYFFSTYSFYTERQVSP